MENLIPPIAVGRDGSKLGYAQRTSTEDDRSEQPTRSGTTLEAIKGEKRAATGAVEGAWATGMARCEGRLKSAMGWLVTERRKRRVTKEHRERSGDSIRVVRPDRFNLYASGRLAKVESAHHPSRPCLDGVVPLLLPAVNFAPA